MKKEKNITDIEKEFGWDVRNFTITNRILFLSSRFSSLSERLSISGNETSKETRTSKETFSAGYFSVLNEGVEIDQKSIFGVGENADESRARIMVDNAQKTYQKIGAFDLFSPNDFKRIHASFNENILNRAGNYRNKAETVFHGKECVFTPPSAKNVPLLIRELFMWAKENADLLPPIVLSSVMHFAIVMIHPFTDGNCQIAKYWQESYLASRGIKMSFSRFEKALFEKRDEYYSKIGESRKEKNLSHFIDFILGVSCETAEMEASEMEIPAATDKYIKKLLNETMPGFSYTTHELLRLMGLRSKETLRRHYLGPALKNGFFEYSKNEKHTSRNQSYIRK